MFLTPEAEHALARSIRAGLDAQTAGGEEAIIRAGREAEAELIAANMGLARSLAKKFARRYRVDFEDAFGAAQIGLVLAARKFDARGTRFTTCATRWIRHEIQSEHERSRPIRIPRLLDPALTTPDPSRSGWADSERARSFDLLDGATPAAEDDGIDAERVRAAVARLPAREREVMALRYGPGECSRQEVARRLGMTRERVRQVEDGALRRLAGMLGERVA